MKTKILIAGLLAALAVVVAVKWFAITPTPPAKASTPVTGRAASAASAVALPPQPATVTATPSLPVVPAEAATPTGAPGAAPVVALAAAAVEEIEAEPVPAIADCGTGRPHDRGLVANQAGNFPRVFIQTNEVVPVSVLFPGGAGAGAVTVRVLDGGSLDGRDITRVLPVDGSGRVNFAFHAGAGRGSYRVTLRRGDWRQQLQFWAGPPHEIARTPLPEGAHLAEKL